MIYKIIYLKLNWVRWILGKKKYNSFFYLILIIILKNILIEEDKYYINFNKNIN